MNRGIFECLGCGHSFQAFYEQQKPKNCPECNSSNISLSKEESLVSKGHGGGCGNCSCGHS
ncbi:hypothetical protein MCHI_003641 [Candidatus Magnetoovum chiemensis]|nr:hypothetical protein MCHI_003641 [Candidatus Magnetoovum chiemensis]